MMQERIVELITLVMQELKNNVKITEIDIESLIEKGYTSSEISSAFSWLVDRLEFDKTQKDVDAFSSDTFRMLHDAENELFDKDGWGELVHLKELGVINSDHVESLIELFMMRGIIKSDARYVKKQVWQNIMEGSFKVDYGSRILLKGNDTIH